MAINKVVYAGKTLMDTSEVTVTTETLLTGYTALDASGTLITGTATGTNNASIPLMFELGELNSSTGAIEESTSYAHSQLININTFKEYTIYIDTTVAGTTGTIRVYSYYSDGSLALRGDSTPFANGSIVLSFPTNAASFRIRVYDSNKYGDTLLNECNNGITLKSEAINEDTDSGLQIPNPIVAGDTPVLYNPGVAKAKGESLTSTGLTLTIPLAGTYRFKWLTDGDPDEDPIKSRLYKNGTAVGTQQSTTSPKNYSLDLECAAGDVITLYLAGYRYLGSYYGVAGGLCACIDWDNGF